VLAVLVVLVVVAGTVPWLRFAHEVGYAGMSRAFGARIDSFVVGVGPRLARLGRLELRLLPLWTVASTAMPSPRGARVAGSIAALVAVYVALALPVFVHMVAGWPTTHATTEIGHVQGHSPAELAGLGPGDHVVSVNGEPVTRPDDVIARVAPSPGRPVQIELDRDGRRRHVEVVPDDVGGRGIVGIVFQPNQVLEPVPIGTALRDALVFHPKVWSMQLEGLVRSFAGAESGTIVGPVGMARTAAESGPGNTAVLALLLASPLAALALLLHLLLPVPGFAAHRVWKGR
jgi:regulator of sigma E protease